MTTTQEHTMTIESVTLPVLAGRGSSHFGWAVYGPEWHEQYGSNETDGRHVLDLDAGDLSVTVIGAEGGPWAVTVVPGDDPAGQIDYEASTLDEAIRTAQRAVGALRA
jgi:hypothetical protein